MKHQTKLSGEQQQVAAQQTESSGARDFANAEEVLRYDAKHTTVPPAVVQRLQKSTGDLPGPKTSWWKRWLGGNEP